MDRKNFHRPIEKWSRVCYVYSSNFEGVISTEIWTDLLQGLLDGAVAAGEIAGANLLVLHRGREVFYGQAGYADVAGEKPFDRAAISRFFSMSKPVTAAAAMVLMEQGKLDLGSPVGAYLPAFAHPMVWENGKKVPAHRQLLIKDLLSMTSGLAYPGEDPAGQEVAAVFAELDSRLYGDDPMTTGELMEKLGGCALAFHPGEKWMYGTSADVLGAVIEKVSGMPFGEYLKKTIFEPLDMVDTGFYVPPEKQERLAKVYEPGAQEYVTNNLGICYTMHRAPAFESGGAGLVSTVDDYSHFGTMLLNGGVYKGRRILSEKTVEFLTTPALTPWQRESAWRSWESLYGYSYGNFMRILEYPGMAQLHGWEGEYGWDGWLGCYFINSPMNGVTVVMTTQLRDAGTFPLTRKIRNVLSANL